MTDPPPASRDPDTPPVEAGENPVDLQPILDAVSDAFLQVDADWRVTYVNAGGREMLGRIGLDGDRILGGNLWEEVPTDPETPGAHALRRAMSEGTVESAESFYEPLERWFEITAFPYGEGLVVLLSDVTGEREVRQALRDVEGRYRAMVEHAPHGLVVIDAEADALLDFNDRALEIFGRSREEMAGSLPYEFSPERQPDGRRSIDAAHAYLQRALDGEHPVFEWLHLRGDGEEIVCEIRLARIPPRERKLVQGSILDITERRRTEEALRESEELYRALFEQDVAGNFVTSAEGRLIACNQAFVEIFGLGSPEEAVGWDVSSLHPSAGNREQIISEIRSRGRLDYHEIEAQTSDGTPLDLMVNARGIFDEDGTLVEIRGHVVDTTERRQLEQQLQRAQRMEAVGRLAGGIAHDFNNLLTAVTGHVDLLLTDPRLPTDLRGDLGKIKKAARRASNLTDQLVAFSRRESPERRPVDLNDVVSDVVDMLQRVIGEDVGLEIHGDEDLWTVWSDRTQLEQVVMNLAVNSRDAMPQGGRLVVRTANVAVDDERRPADLEPGRYVLLEVEDSGTGIPQDRIARIFEPFYSTKGPGKGSGLGLAMVYGIVRRNRGHIDVDSTEGEGTTVSIFLPADDGASGAHPDPAPGAEGRTTVLLLQHDPAVRTAVRRVLRQDGFSVLEAEDVEEAAASCRQWERPIHLVISDPLDERDEREIRDALADHPPSTPFLWTWEKEAGTLPDTGDGDALLQKPFSSRELGQRLREVLADDPPPPDPR